MALQSSERTSSGNHCSYKNNEGDLHYSSSEVRCREAGRENNGVRGSKGGGSGEIRCWKYS